MKKKYLPLLFSMLFYGFTFQSQAQKTITGTVTSDSVKVLPGVTVEIQGTTIATLTDQDGRFTISAGDESILVFRLQGYISQQVPLNGRTQLNVVLQRNRDSARIHQNNLIPVLQSLFNYCRLNYLQIAKLKIHLPMMAKLE